MSDVDSAQKVYKTYLMVDNFIEILMENEKSGANEYTFGLKSKKDYEQLLKPVAKIYLENEKDIKKSFEAIIEQSEICDLLKQFIIDNKMAPGAVIAFGTKKHQEILYLGNQQEVADNGDDEIIPMAEDSIFDLSSVTKIFTCLMVLKLVEMQKIKLSDKIYNLDNRFINLREVSVEDLLTFKVPLKTKQRLETLNDLKEIEKEIFEIMPGEPEVRLYSDMGAMVLKYVVENIMNDNFYRLVQIYILQPCQMNSTCINIPEDAAKRIVSNNFERRIINGSYVTLDKIFKGVVSDGKTRAINSFGVQLTGHAGLFSTAGDMAKLAMALMEEKVLSIESLKKIGINRTGKMIGENDVTQFHGYLCYSKNPIEMNSEVNHFLSGNAFALGGYTGKQLTIDIENGVYVFFASNRCHNRVTNITGAAEKDYVRDGYAKWNNGKNYKYNKRYAYDRDDYVMKPAVELVLKYRCLEYILGESTMKTEKECIVRKL